MSIMQVGDGTSQPTENVTVDSLAALMGDDDDAGALDSEGEGELPEEAEGEEAELEASDDDSDEAEDSTETITVNGKEVTLTKAEMKEMAQKGFDYTQKTMAVSEERKAVEAAAQHVEQRRQQVDHAYSEQIGRLQALERFYSEQVGTPPPVEWASQDVAYYIAQKEQYEARKGQLDQARRAIAQMQDEQARQRQAFVVQQAEATERALKDTLPGWSDTTLNELIDYAGKFGVGQSVAGDVLLQKGFWEIAHKAKAYDALMAKKAEMKPVNQLPRVAKPSAQNQPSQLARRQDAMKAHKAKPSMTTLANLL